MATKPSSQPSQLERAKKALSEHHHRVTKSRLAVARALIAHNSLWITPEEIHQQIQNQELVACDLTSVYRTLTLFERLGLVARSEFYGEAARYGWRSERPDDSCEHAHFFKCKNCQEVEPLSQCLFADLAKSLAKRGFTNLEHRFEVTGLCPNCR